MGRKGNGDEEGKGKNKFYQTGGRGWDRQKSWVFPGGEGVVERGAMQTL